MNHAVLWETVVASALMGTDRQPFTLPKTAGSLGELLAQIDTSNPESALLSAAATISLHRQVGQSPIKTNEPLLSPCEPQDVPCCNARAVRHLRLMLSGGHNQVLPEWLAALAAIGQRVPEICLPDLLDQGQRQSFLREAIVRVVGKRGQWLAAQNTDWVYATGIDPQADWETGNRAARLLWVRQQRAENANQAREQLVATWKQETASDRAAFLEALQIGLSMADEPFLEAALDDRSKEVRRVAADLLAGLPESRLCQRMIDRTQPLLKLLRKRQKLQIEVVLPEVCDAAMIRDGIEPRPTPGLGEKAGWLQQMLGAVPPRIWAETWEASPAEIIQAIDRQDWKEVLWEGWALATYRHQDMRWAETLLSKNSRLKRYSVARLLKLLPPDQQTALILNLLQSDHFAYDSKHPAFSLLQQYQHPWNWELTQVVLEAVCESLLKDHNHWEWSSLLKDFACRIPPNLLPAVTTLMTFEGEGSVWAKLRDRQLSLLPDRSSEETEKPAWATNVIQEFLALLQFRHDMLEALAQE